MFGRFLSFALCKKMIFSNLLNFLTLSELNLFIWNRFIHELQQLRYTSWPNLPIVLIYLEPPLTVIHLDPVSNQAMQDEIKLLNVKLVELNEGSRRLHGLYDKSLEEKRNLKTQVSFQIDASRSASDWMISQERRFDWLWASPG